MNAAFKSLVFGSLFAGLVSLAAVASAAPPVQIRLSFGGSPRVMPLVPATPVVPATPRLGFYGHFEWGYGMIVDSVAWGTPARRMGLESGDLIVAVNGLWLRSQSDYYRALGYSGDHAQVTVQDVRTGRLITRTAHLHSGYYDAAPAGYGGSSVSIAY